MASRVAGGRRVASRGRRKKTALDRYAKRVQLEKGKRKAG